MKYNVESLEKMGIHQLRDIGHDVGVKLPTIYKKDELIQKILAIVSGKEEPYVKATKRGRPSKSLGYSISEKEGFFNAGMLDFYFSNEDSLGDDCFKISCPKLNADLIDDSEIVVDGVVELLLNGLAKIYILPVVSTNSVTVSHEEIEKFNLQMGDIVKLCVKHDSNGCYNFVSIVENCCNHDHLYNFLMTEKEDEKEVIGNEKFDSVIPFCFGDRAISFSKNKIQDSIFLLDVLKKFNSNKKITDVVFVGVNVGDEFLNECKKLEKVKLMVSTFGDSKNLNFTLFNLAFMCALNLSSEISSNVVFVVQNVPEFYSNKTDNEEKVANYYKKCFTIAKRTSLSSLSILYSFVESCNIFNEYRANENVFFEVLEQKHLTKAQIKYNILNSCRNSFSKEFALCNEKISSFLEKGDYFENHLLLESIIEKSQNLNEAISKL